MVKIPNGCVLLARKILNSDIWNIKPAWWLKVWLYILMKVNHADNKYSKRGENFFTYEQIYNDCHLVCEGNDTKSIDNLTRWLKRTTQITTRKTTRGFFITIYNYELYQNMNNYRNDTENDTENEIKTTEKRQRNDTINNNVNNDKNIKKVVPAEDFIQSLKTNTAYSHINIDQELGKMDAWLLARPGRKKTRRFIVAWLNRIEKPLPINGPQRANKGKGWA